VWGTALRNFDDLFQLSELEAEEDSSAISSDKSAFLRLIARQYFKVTARAIRKYDPNHLILGCRFAGYAPDEVLKEVGEFVDVVSYNTYDLLPPTDKLERIHHLTGKPIMITEFSFKAMDSGLPNTKGAGKPVETQQDRADSYEGYVTAALSLPYMVGLHWFEHADEPAEGRFDGENSNYGVVDIDDEVYTVLTDRMTAINAKAIEIAR
jgi:agarase